MAKAKSPIPPGFHTLTPHLMLDDATEAIEWYKKAFGAEEVAPRALSPDGKIMHAELRIGNSVFMLNDVMGGGRSARATGGSPIGLWIYVDDCDNLYKRAVAAGAQVLPPPMGPIADQFWGDRTATVNDPFGFNWTIATRKEDLTPEEVNQRMQDFMKRFAAQRQGAPA
jgi:PhnB protein